MAQALTPAPRQMLELTVIRRTWLSPHLVRVTVGGRALDRFTYEGGDQCFRLFFPQAGHCHLHLPTVSESGWAQQYFQMPDDSRPVVRNYTVRDFHASELELDVDFVVHGEGPAALWAQTAQPGSPVGIFDEGRRYWPREDASWQWLVVDESALPAALAIAEEASVAPPTRIIAEVPSPADILDVGLGSHITVDWLTREGSGAAAGSLARDAALDTPLPVGTGSVFVAGERSMATGVRRGLVATGVPKSTISFFGYWRGEGAEPD